MLSTPLGLRVDTMAMGRGTISWESMNWRSIGWFSAGSKVMVRSGSMGPDSFRVVFVGGWRLMRVDAARGRWVQAPLAGQCSR